jgi:hypothetical protein
VDGWGGSEMRGAGGGGKKLTCAETSVWLTWPELMQMRSDMASAAPKALREGLG